MVASILNPTSYFGIILFLVLTGCGMPIPEEVAIVLAGVLSAEGHLVPSIALAACLVGAVLGDSIMYGIGYRWGNQLLRVNPRLGQLLEGENHKHFQQEIDRHGLKVMMLSRFMVGVRGPVYVAAGAVRMPYRKFLLCDVICATVTVGFFFALSYQFGDEVMDWIRNVEWTLTALVALALVLAGGYLYFRHGQVVSRMFFGPGMPDDVDR